MGLADFFTRTFKELGGEIVIDVSYKAGDQDFKAQLTKLKYGKPELIYVPGYYTDVALIGRQSRELGLNVPLAGGDGWDSAKLYEIAQGALDGGFFTNHYAAENPSPVVQDFVKKYEAAYHAKPDAFGALGYDAARLAVDAMNRATDLTPGAIRDAIEKTTDLQGVTARSASTPTTTREVRGDHRHREERAEVRDDRRSLDEDGRGSVRVRCHATV